MDSYRLCFKIDSCEDFPNGLSDSLGINFRTVQAAQTYAAKLRQDPNSVGEHPCLKSASLWVSDEIGNVYSEV